MSFKNLNDINIYNHRIVQKYIEEKQQLDPSYRVGILPTQSMVYTPITDFDHFPYQRFYRGTFENQQPQILEREAGFRTRHDACYQYQYIAEPVPKPDLYFQSACSTTYPTYKTNPTVCIASYY